MVFDLGLGKKGNQGIPRPQGASPVAEVIQLRQQGYNNDQIIQQLQSRGFNITQIYDAMSQADMKRGISGNNYPNMPEEPMEQPAPPMRHEEEPIGTEDIEEIAEAIIDERWNELVKGINKIIEWKEQTEIKLTKIDQELDDIRNSFDKLHKGVLQKIGQYDKNLLEVGSNIKAMETMFSKVLPSFTENVDELSRITDKIKKSKKKK